MAALPVFFTGYAIERWEGVVFLGYYVAYTLFLVLQALEHDLVSTYATGMLYFVIPLTVLTAAVIALRAWRGTQARPA